METELSLLQYRFLRQLAGADGAVRLQDLKPKLKINGAERQFLVDREFVLAGKQKKSLTFAATTKGREWIAAHAEEPKKPKKPRPAKVPKPSKLPPLPSFPTPRQRLFLYRLAFLPLDAPPGGVGSLLKLHERDPLVKERWVDEEEVGRATRFKLSEKGWQWVDEHLADPVPGRGLPESVVWNVLAHVGTYLSANGLHIADLIRAKSRSTASVETDSPRTHASNGDIKAAIRDACRRLGGGQSRQRIRLALLRRELDGWPRTAVDGALLDLSLSSDLVLEAFDDPREVLEEDRNAVFKTPSGEVRHLVYLN